MPVCPKCHEENPQLGARCPRDGHYFIPQESLTDAKRDPIIGTLAADKYVILGLISEGGMGAVYRALQLPVEREVALKVLRTELQDSDQGRDRFILEARAVSRLNHPNIITLHDFGFDSEKHPYMVMEYAPGKSLARWLRDDIDLERIVHVMEQVLSALSEAHDRGIVHRDLKPENMIVTRAGDDHDYVKLLDFGIARIIEEGSTRKLTREGEVFGTPHYMAPEQAQGRKNVGPPADVYACGIILWELLTGNCPFDAPTPLAVLFMHINEELPELVPRAGILCPPEVKQVIVKATSKKPLARYQHAGEMLKALKTAVKDYVKRTTLSGNNGLQAIDAERRKKALTPPPAQPASSGFDPARPLNLASRAESDASDNLVKVFDPDPSLERDALGTNAAASQSSEPVKHQTLSPEDADKAKLKLSLAAVAILILFAGVVVAATFALGGDDTEAAEANGEVAESEEPEDDTKETEVASSDTAEKKVEETKPTVKEEPAKVEEKVEDVLPTSTKIPIDPKSVAGHAPPGFEPEKKDDAAKSTEADTVEEVKPKPKETKKVASTKKMPKPKESTKKKSTEKTAPKKVETEPKKETKKADEPKKFEFKKAKSTPTRWDR